MPPTPWRIEPGRDPGAVPGLVYVEDRDEWLPRRMPPVRQSQMSGPELTRRLMQASRSAMFPIRKSSMSCASLSAAQQQALPCSSPVSSGSGKSTVARALTGGLMEMGAARLLMDGDSSQDLSPELGFSKGTDIKSRIGFVASEITKHGGIAICAPIGLSTDAARRAGDVEHWGVSSRCNFHLYRRCANSVPQGSTPRGAA